MTISKETILNKMLDEVQQARKSVHHQPEIINHISKVKLLCELLLEEQNEKAQSTGSIESRERIITEKHLTSAIPSENNKDGTSIFDF